MPAKCMKSLLKPLYLLEVLACFLACLLPDRCRCLDRMPFFNIDAKPEISKIKWSRKPCQYDDKNLNLDENILF